MWEDLLEIRILAQKALSVANQLPKAEAHYAFGALNDAAKLELAECAEEAGKVTKEFRATEAELVQSNEEVSEACGSFGAGAIESEDEDEDGGESPVDVEGLWEMLSQDFEAHRPYREEVIAKWGRKAQLSKQFQVGTEFKAFNKTVNQQIDEVLSDKSRLIKRTQLRRSQYQVMGDDKTDADVAKTEPSHVINIWSSMMRRFLMMPISIQSC